MSFYEFTPTKLKKHIWEIHHNNNALKIMQGTSIKVRKPYPETWEGVQLEPNKLTFMEDFAALHFDQDGVFEYNACGEAEDGHCEVCFEHDIDRADMMYDRTEESLND